MLQAKTIQSEKGLRDLIFRNLNKEFHPGTKPSIDFIHTILEESFDSGMVYDVTDLRSRIIAFANNSTNQAMYCLNKVMDMKFKSEVEAEPASQAKDDRLVFYDVEVFPNLLTICWKYRGSDNVVRMRNPSPQEVEALFNLKLVGFNVRRYDNHILYARYMGYNNEQLYALSQKVINNDRSAMFGAAYDISYADIYDYSSKKQGLKRFQIELGLPHVELGLPWDEPVPEDMIEQVEEYCVSDVNTTEAVFEARYQDFVARQILADLSGLTVNDTTQRHTARIIFGNDKNHKEHFVYTDLSEEFPGYEFDLGKSSYKGDAPSEGGYVYAEPGIYEDVGVLDIASMHPTSIIQLNLFGDYTTRFQDLLDARLAIKRGNYDLARTMLDGKLEPHLGKEEDAEALSYALKIVINIVYGLTSASFDNPFRDIRNKDNIVAKRGALFMIDLKNALQEKGWPVVHIKTDSVKIPNVTQEMIDFVIGFGREYGYDFEHEVTYDKFCLVNDAVYIARKSNCLENCWDAVGAQFQHPYVYKSLFSGEEVRFEDFLETKQVTKGSLYLDYDAVEKPMFEDQNLVFVGRIGQFIPVTEEAGGAILWRIDGEKKHHVSGTKGHLWLEAAVAKDMIESDEASLGDILDMDFFEKLADAAVKTIDKFGSYEEFVK